MKRRAKVVLLLAMLLTATQSTAGPEGCTNFPTLTPFRFETITVSSTAIGFTAATFAIAGEKAADMAVVTTETNAVRYRADGLNPSATVGHVIAPDGTVSVCGEQSLRKVRFIRRDAADATLSVTYYRGGDQ